MPHLQYCVVIWIVLMIFCVFYLVEYLYPDSVVSAVFDWSQVLFQPRMGRNIECCDVPY